jgi:sugar/nucleoside kinase (ribokinase family)
MNDDLQFDYTAVGHVTIDVLADGSRRAGGTALFSALQASRLGRRTLIVTRGVPREIEALVEPHRDELELVVLPAAETTTLAMAGADSVDTQRVLAWAGPIGEQLVVQTSILHLAPVARETPPAWRGRASFVGLTAQGLARDWSGAGRRFVLARPSADSERVADRCDAIVVSERERASCAELLAAAVAGGSLVAVTAADGPTEILTRGAAAVELDVAAIAEPVDDVGAGDVFAAAWFVALTEGAAALDAARFASAAAAVRIQGAGVAAVGTRAQIDARLAALDDAKA